MRAVPPLDFTAGLREAAGDLDLERFLPEAVVIDGADLYLHLPNGMGRAKLPVSLGRQLAVPVTFRNWNTVAKLAELAGG